MVDSAVLAAKIAIVRDAVDRIRRGSFNKNAEDFINEHSTVPR